MLDTALPWKHRAVSSKKPLWELPGRAQEHLSNFLSTLMNSNMMSV